MEKGILPFAEIIEVKSRMEVIKENLEDSKFLPLAVDGKGRLYREWR